MNRYYVTFWYKGTDSVQVVGGVDGFIHKTEFNVRNTEHDLGVLAGICRKKLTAEGVDNILQIVVIGFTKLED